MLTVGVFEKGRSCYFALLSLCRRAAAIQIAGDIQWRLRFIETKRNVADAGSRGQVEEPPPSALPPPPALPTSSSRVARFQRTRINPRPACPLLLLHWRLSRRHPALTGRSKRRQTVAALPHRQTRVRLPQSSSRPTAGRRSRRRHRRRRLAELLSLGPCGLPGGLGPPRAAVVYASRPRHSEDLFRIHSLYEALSESWVSDV